MGKIKILVIFIFGALLSSTKGEIGRKDKPILDLDDYIDSGQGATQTVAVANTNTKREELRASETGYYGAHPQHGHAHHHHHSPHGYQHHGHVLYETHGHHHGYYHPYDYGHAHTYHEGIYGGYGHLGSAHVSYGTHINHGHAHSHHHGFYG